MGPPRAKLFPASVSALNSWPEELQIKIFDVCLADIAGLRGVIAKNNIVSQSVIVSVDSKLALETINNRPPTPFPDFCPQSLWKDCLWDNRLAFMLLYEKKVLDQKSVRKAWLEELPSEFSTPTHWTEYNFNETQYETLKISVGKQISEWRKFYYNWQQQLVSPKSFPVSFEEFVWAHECVKSRAFSGTYEGSSLNERKSLLILTFALTLLWPLVGLGTVVQSISAAVLVLISILLKDIFSSKLVFDSHTF